MSDNINVKATENTQPAETVIDDSEVTLGYILEQLAIIQKQTEYLNNAMEKVSQMGDGDSGEPGSPGNILGQAKAQAIVDIVKCRETTNQQLIGLYKQIYNDIFSGNSPNIVVDTKRHLIQEYIENNSLDVSDIKELLALLD